MKIHYSGGKSGFGVYQKYINNMPPHDIYIETHLGGGGLMRRKLSAKQNIGIDIDPQVMELWSEIEEPKVKLYNEDAVSFLKNYKFSGRELVYCDPPYLRETRQDSGKLYKFEYTTAQHIELLETIKKIPAMVMISGYESTLYKTYLEDWRCYSFKAKTHKSTAIEWIWMNYAEPVELHDYRYLGNNFREREKLKRNIQSWKTRFEKMTLLQRQALLCGISSVMESES